MIIQEFDLTGAGYVFENATSIWRRANAEPFGYSDGDQIEQGLADILRRAADLSTLSAELNAQCTDWPRRYHLHSARSNLMRPLAGRLKGDILEIGAGCGAITRFLGENGANVLALEGSQRRASIAALRTRDLPNVTVVSDRFQSFAIDRQFDVVTLIGVLEYAALFSSAEEPVAHMLESVRRLLKPEGILVIAIENQLGLKYLAGAPEDHVGQRMFGVQDLYEERGVRTFGKEELERRLRDAGFASTALALPFPDYKLPVSVVTPSAFRTKLRFQPAVFAAQSVVRDAQISSSQLTFSLERVWHTIGRNGLLEDVANSFLFVASPAGDAQSAFHDGHLAYHYSVERLPAFAKAATFIESGESISVVREPLSIRFAPSSSDYAHNIGQEAFVDGETLDEAFRQILATRGWQIRQIADVLNRYVDALFALAGPLVRRSVPTNASFALPGEMLDVVPQNIVVGEDGAVHAIDREWIAKQPLPLYYMMFRALTLMLRSMSTCAPPADARMLNRRTLFAETLSCMGFPFDQAAIEDCLRREASFMSFATGRAFAQQSVEGWASMPIPSELDLRTYSFDSLLQKAQLLASKTADVEQKLAAANARMTEHDKTNAASRSKSFRHSHMEPTRQPSAAPAKAAISGHNVQAKPIRLVCATRHSREVFSNETALGRSLKLYSHLTQPQLHLFDNNTLGLSTVYNHAIQQAQQQPAILVFIHDDVWLGDLFWAERIAEAVTKFDVAGVAGNKRRVDRQPAWAFITPEFQWDDRQFLSGTVGHGKGFPCSNVSSFGPSGVEVKLLDGLLIAADSETLVNNGLRFDEQFAFHFYDMDFCRQAELKGLRMGTWPLSVVHESGGAFGSEGWRNGYERYLRKYGH